MQICKNCGAEIKYIATDSETSAICDSEKKMFVTENGRKLYGYLIHKCKEPENKNEENK